MHDLLGKDLTWGSHLVMPAMLGCIPLEVHSPVDQAVE